MEEYLDTAELAELLGLAEITVKQWRQHKKGPPFVRVSHRCVRYKRSDVDRWMCEKQEAKP